jgi:hypothetical protein
MEDVRWKMDDIVHPVEYYLFIPRGKVFSPELDSGLKLGECYWNRRYAENRYRKD